MACRALPLPLLPSTPAAWHWRPTLATHVVACRALPLSSPHVPTLAPPHGLSSIAVASAALELRWKRCILPVQQMQLTAYAIGGAYFLPVALTSAVATYAAYAHLAA